VLYQLCAKRRNWWPDQVTDVDVAEIVTALNSTAVFAQWVVIDPSWPLARMIHDCLSRQPSKRPTAHQLLTSLLSCAPDPLSAVITERNRWLAHDLRSELAAYVQPLTTPLETVERVAEEKGAAVKAVMEEVDDFLRSDIRTLVLLGDGGVGKSLTLMRLAGADGPQGWLVVPLRPGLQKWSHRELHGAAEEALRAFGSAAAPSNGKILFVFDAYDELEGDEAPADNLPAVLGVSAWPGAKLILTARRNTVPTLQLPQRFGRHTLRYLLPFTAAQIHQLMARRAVPDDQIRRTLTMRAVVENPFVLRLYCGCWGIADELAKSAAAPLNAWHIYDAGMRKWAQGAAQVGGLPAAVVNTALPNTNLHDPTALHASFAPFAERVAHAMFADAVVTAEAGEAEPWVQLHHTIAADSHRPRLTAFRLRQLSTFFTGCPLQSRDNFRMLTFAHKSYRDFLAAAAAVREVEAGKFTSLSTRPLTYDLPVLQFAALRIRPAVARDYDPTNPATFAVRAKEPFACGLWDSLYASKQQAAAPSLTSPTIKAAANAASILNCAAVPFSGRDLSNVVLGHDHEHKDAPSPYAVDLWGAVMQGTDLTGAQLNNVRLQQAMLRDGKLTNAKLANVVFGENAAFRGHTHCVTSLCLSPDGKVLYSGSYDNTIRAWSADSGQVKHGAALQLVHVDVRSICAPWKGTPKQSPPSAYRPTARCCIRAVTTTPSVPGRPTAAR
jgi:hypothetical protein